MFLRKIFLWLLFSVFVFTQTPLLEIVKIPYLIEHFQEHKTQYKNLSFIQFLKMHYFGEKHIGTINESDHQLPFKSDLNSIGIALFHFVSPIQILVLSLISLVLLPVLIKRNNRLIPQYKANLIWQPPKK